MASHVPAKRRRPSSLVATRSSNLCGGGHSSVAGSSPILRAQSKRDTLQPPARQVLLRASSPRESSVLSSSSLGLQRSNRRPAGNEQISPETSYGRGADIDEREEDDSMNEVIMAVDLRGRGTVGCAYYVAREEKLYMMEDIRFGGIEVIETSNELEPAYIVEVRPSPEFGYEAGKTKLASIPLVRDLAPHVAFVTPDDVESYQEDAESNDQAYSGRKSKLLRLSGLVDLESRLTVGCVGAVLTYLQRRKAVAYLPGDTEANQAFRISSIETFNLAGSMFIDAETLSALQIMHSQTHPQSHNQGSSATGSKEGLSIYGLFHHLARTPQGKHRLRQYFLRPSLDIDTINERLETATIFLRPDNSGLLDSMARSLGQIKNMRAVVLHLRKGLSNGIGKGSSGIKSGVWSSLRSVNDAEHPMAKTDLPL
ncbi:MAG: hypothetical protein LQ338_004150 [Usnochroma carphineum]|nr:MAG: hypothetical protein LQ338_004150 [Usnochroma carphineum]